MQKRVALVTGAASGIGLAVAESLANAGYQVVMADVNAEIGGQQAGRIGAHFVKVDLTDASACKALVAEAAERFGSVDVLVNNAGIQHVSPIELYNATRVYYTHSIVILTHIHNVLGSME